MCKVILNPKVCRCSNDTDCPKRQTRSDKQYPGHIASEINQTGLWPCNDVLHEMAKPYGLGLMTITIPMDNEGTTISLNVFECPNTVAPPIEITEELYTSPILCMSCFQNGCYRHLTIPLDDTYWKEQASRSNLSSWEMRQFKLAKRRSTSRGSSSGSSTVRNSTETIRESNAESSSKS